MELKKVNKDDKRYYEDGTEVLISEDRPYHWKFTVDELKEFPDHLYKMNEPDCLWFLENFPGRHGYRVPVGTRLKQIRTARRKTRQHAKIKQTKRKREIAYNKAVHSLEMILECLRFTYDKIQTNGHEVGTHEYEGLMNSIGRLVGNTVHDLPGIQTGKYSLAAYDETNHMNGVELTWEHYYPRTRTGGVHVFDHYNMYRAEGLEYGMKELITIMLSNCEVARTTRTENSQDLYESQQPENFILPPQSYADSGITVVDVHEPLYNNPLWNRLVEEYDAVYPPVCEFPDAITIEEADKLLKAQRKSRS